MYTNGVYTSIIGTQGSASCKSGPDEMYKQYSILHGDNGAHAQQDWNYYKISAGVPEGVEEMMMKNSNVNAWDH